MAIIKPTPTFANGLVTPQLDMRPSNKLGKELRTEIIKSVEHTQKFIVQELPSRLLLSHRQFVSLLDYLDEMYQTTDRLFRTPLNVMEVIVDEDVDPVTPEELNIPSDLVIYSEPVGDHI